MVMPVLSEAEQLHDSFEKGDTITRTTILYTAVFGRIDLLLVNAPPTLVNTSKRCLDDPGGKRDQNDFLPLHSLASSGGKNRRHRDQHAACAS